MKDGTFRTGRKRLRMSETEPVEQHESLPDIPILENCRTGSLAECEAEHPSAPVIDLVPHKPTSNCKDKYPLHREPIGHYHCPQENQERVIGNRPAGGKHNDKEDQQVHPKARYWPVQAQT